MSGALNASFPLKPAGFGLPNIKKTSIIPERELRQFNDRVTALKKLVKRFERKFDE
jgi:hypothetical protein